MEGDVLNKQSRHYGTIQHRMVEVDIAAVRLARVEAVEKAAPWKTKVSQLMKLFKEDAELNAIKQPVLRRFYEDQNEMISFMEERYIMDQEGRTETVKQDEEASTASTQLAINLSFALNVALVVLKMIALVISGSVAMLASVIDSFLDLLSGAVLFVTRRAMDRTDIYLYPQGKRRLEPVGVVVFATVMAISALQIVREAAQRVVEGLMGKPHVIDVDWTVLIVVFVTVGSKFFMCIFCKIVAERTGSGSVAAYAADHGNDVISNLVGIAGMLAAAKAPVVWYMDPIAAILISLYIMINWITTGLEHIDMVVGKSANAIFLRKLIFLAMNHHEEIQAVDTTRAYHFGDSFLVETDIVLSNKMELEKAHDIGESLQIKIEDLEEVERAFVHLDTETEHKPEHKKRT